MSKEWASLEAFDTLDRINDTTVRIRKASDQNLWTTIAFLPGLHSVFSYLAMAGDGPSVLVRAKHAETLRRALERVSLRIFGNDIIPSATQFDLNRARLDAEAFLSDFMDENDTRDFGFTLEDIREIEAEDQWSFLEAIKQIDVEFNAYLTDDGPCHIGLVPSDEATFAVVAAKTALRLMGAEADGP